MKLHLVPVYVCVFFELTLSRVLEASVVDGTQELRKQHKVSKTRGTDDTTGGRVSVLCIRALSVLSFGKDDAVSEKNEEEGLARRGTKKEEEKGKDEGEKEPRTTREGGRNGRKVKKEKKKVPIPITNLCCCFNSSSPSLS